MEIHYCWRCEREMAMLDEAEYAEVALHLSRYLSAVKAYRAEHGVGIAEARASVPESACAVYERLTGFSETDPDAIYHHRRSLHGPPCPQCGRLLRTPQASFCAACGWRPKPSAAA